MIEIFLSLFLDSGRTRLYCEGEGGDSGEGQRGDANVLCPRPQDLEVLEVRPHGQPGQQQPRRGRVRNGSR